MGITIKEIAKLAGVSTSTVSLVLSEKGYVSDTTQRKVQKIIDEYNYRPSGAARQLASNQTGNIGFIISDVHLSRSEAFYTRILLGSELEARNYDANIILSSVGQEYKLPRFLKEKNVDGIIIAGSVSDELIPFLKEDGCPVVLIDFDVDGMALDKVAMDNRRGVQMAVEHLLEQKISKIGFVGGSYYHPSIRERFEGYQIAMDRGGNGDIAHNKKYRYLTEDETSTDIGEKGTAEILKAVPDLEAIICVNDTTAMGCLKYLLKHGIEIPAQMSVVGFDDVNFAAVAHPPLTSVHVPKVEMGMAGVKLLKERIENPDRAFQTRTLPVELVIRESSMSNKQN
ncbi:MAG: LacI family DNA-binding transcriptional regulator [Candidatus Neomarinimicrobiota bacterium]